MSTISSDFKKPPPPSELRLLRKKKKVLDEDEYVETISAIVERDFFPDLKRMRSKMDLIEGNVSFNGPLLGNTPRNSVIDTPLTFDTPEQVPQTVRADVSNDFENEKEEMKDSAPAIGLDTFLANHTGEDNESFNDIMRDSDKAFKVKNSWMFKSDEMESVALTNESLNLPSIESQAKTNSNNVVQTWKYKNRNSVFYDPEGVPLSNEEAIQAAKKNRKIVLENTRFQYQPWEDKNTLQKKSEILSGKVGVDGKEVLKNETPSVNGYNLIRMDSPAIDPSASPLMTWGEIDSTPARIESGTPCRYTMQQVPKRDQIAHDLAEKNAKFYRDKKGKAIKKARTNMLSPAGSFSERLSSLSPAAQRLASSNLGIRLNTGKSVKASPSPFRKTPSVLGSNFIKKASATPISSIPSSPVGLTDNMLKIKKRPKASDFFDL